MQPAVRLAASSPQRATSLLLALRRWPEALAALQALAKLQLQVNEIHYNVVLKACGWKQSCFVLEAMQACGIKPDGRTFSAAINLCRGSGLWELAFEHVRDMAQAKAQYDPVVFSAALGTAGQQRWEAF
eukprot:s1322_g10.t1